MSTTKKIYNIPNIICRNVLYGHEGPVERVIIANNHIISGSRDKTIKIWDIKSGNEMSTLRGHTDTITSLSFHEPFLASGSKDNTVKIWNINTGECLKTFIGHGADVLHVHITESLVISCSVDSTIKLWNIENGNCIKTLTDHTRNVSWVKIAKNRIYSLSWDHFLRIWDLDTGECLEGFDRHFDAINTGDLSEKYIVSGDQSGIIFVWDLDTREIIHQLKHHKRAIMGLFIDQDYLYSTSMDRTVMIWDLKTGICVKKLEGHEDATLGIWKSKNYIVSSSADNTIRIWDDFSIHAVANLQGHESLVLGVRADNNIAVSTGTDNVIKVWDIKNKVFLRDIPLNFKSWIWGLAFGENRILVSSDQGIYRVYDLKDGQLLHELHGHEGSTYRAAIKGNLAITSGWDMTARVWDLESGECLHILEGHTYPVYSGAITDDGHFITGSSDGTIRIWDSAGKQEKVINFHTDEIFHIHVQGDILASASADGICGVFNWRSGDILAQLDDHFDQVWCVQLYKHLVITGSADNTIKIWDYHKNLCLDTLEGHTDNVKDLSIGNNQLISGSFDSTIKIWDLSRYLGKSEEIIISTTVDFDCLTAQIQMARTYDLIPEKYGDPGLLRIIYGMKPNTDSESTEQQEMIYAFKELGNSWHKLGMIGYAPWILEIGKGINSGIVPLDQDESLEIVLQKYLGGLREHSDLYWLGLIRRFGTNLDSLFPINWTFTLEFSGQGPNPIDGFKWSKLTSRINSTRLEDREETALVFKLTLKNVNVWIFPLIKAIEIQIKDDRGDVSYMHFNNFLPNSEGDWETTAMFKIDQGYKMEPTAILNVTDIRVLYDDSLSPSYQGSSIIKQLNEIRYENQIIRDQLQILQENLVTLSEDIASCNLEIPEPKKTKTYLKNVNKDYKLNNLDNSPKSLKIFKKVKSCFTTPRIGLIRVEIGEYMNKFLEYIQPKFVLFTAGTSIASVLLGILIILSGTLGWDKLREEIPNNFDLVLNWAQIVVYVLIYAILSFIIVVSIISWVRYQRQKKKMYDFSPPKRLKKLTKK